MIAFRGEPTRVVKSLSRITDNPMDWQECANHEDSLDSIYDGLHRQGRTDEALAIALRELRNGSSAPPTLRAAFRGYHALGLATHAIEIGGRLLESDPGDSEIVVHTARLLVELGDYATAAEVLDRARATDHANVALRLERLAILLVWEDAPNRAEDFVSQYQQLVAYASRNRGTALRRLRLGAAFFAGQERWIEAETAYRAILRLAPDDAGAIRGLERVTDSQGR
jgi:tetratricopeptide (TPR) repeat protein